MASDVNGKCGCLKNMFEKQEGAGYNRAYGWSEEDVVGKQDGSVR